MEDRRRFCDGSGDADSVHISPLIADYYNLPIIGGVEFAINYPTLQMKYQEKFESDVRLLHEELRKEMGIPRSAFEPQTMLVNVGQFRPLVFKEEFSRNHRALQIEFQGDLDMLVQAAYEMKYRELVELIRSGDKIMKNIGITLLVSSVFGVFAYYFLKK